MDTFTVDDKVCLKEDKKVKGRVLVGNHENKTKNTGNGEPNFQSGVAVNVRWKDGVNHPVRGSGRIMSLDPTEIEHATGPDEEFD